MVKPTVLMTTVLMILGPMTAGLPTGEGRL